MKSVVAVFSLALLLAGCANSMQADVTQFSGPAALPPGRNFVVSAEPDQSGSLEFQHYAGLVGGALQDHGFHAASPNTNADLVVMIHYGSAGNHTELWSDPAWGWGGGWGRRHGGPWGPETESRTYYAQLLEIEIYDGTAWRNNVHTMLYQGRAVGDATVNEISAAVPALVQALFTHFPGNSGQTERIVVPMPSVTGAP